MLLDKAVAQRVSDNILSLYDWILAVSIMGMRGNILTANSKQSFKDTFGVTRDGEEYGGTLTFTILSLVNQVRDVFGDAQAIITIHKNCKLMQLPMQSYEILVGLVIHSSANAEDGQIAKNIEPSLQATSWTLVFSTEVVYVDLVVMLTVLALSLAIGKRRAELQVSARFDKKHHDVEIMSNKALLIASTTLVLYYISICNLSCKLRLKEIERESWKAANWIA